MTDERAPISSDPLPRISIDDETTELIDAEQLRAARSTPLPGGWSTSRSTPQNTTLESPTDTPTPSEVDTMKPPHKDDNVIPTDPPPPPPKKFRAARVLVPMLIAGIILWRIWPWVAPHFGR